MRESLSRTSLGYNVPERSIDRSGLNRKNILAKIKALWTQNVKAIKMSVKKKRLFAQIKEISSYGNRPLSILSLPQKTDLPQYARQVLLENLLRNKEMWKRLPKRCNAQKIPSTLP